MTGNIVINDNGDREADYTLDDFDPDTGLMRPVATYYGSLRSYVRIPGVEILWPGGKAEAPIDVPLCGFTGNDIRCRERSKAPLIVSMLSVTFILGLSLGITLFFVNKRIQRESDLADMWWKINSDELVFQESRKTKRSRSSQSLEVSSSSIGSRSRASSRSSRGVKTGTIYSTTINVEGIDVAMFRGAKVAVKPVELVSEVHVTRDLLIEMKQMRDVIHDNLVKFYGMVVEPPTAIVSELCMRGSLRDMLDNESVNIDWLFRYEKFMLESVCLSFSLHCQIRDPHRCS